ncbi:hypothetical protein DCS_00621 [Drechmeria coniospora]|uniref:Uncharacterized protein n=1 Tax=Drechmeria coniospora TaxID=98403 RepID=A0A151GR11_DRECN|nr:hypothetical protein DCS_00621 [Drechmeria coniospora]KYK59491.1 hypothetical protein DCS_00621 [Drechmeria coniospora]
MTGVGLRLTLLALLALCDSARANKRDSTPTSTLSTVPIFIPGYGHDQWSLLRGSIISSTPTATETTYTIFCPVQTPPACELSLEFPFIIAEGPGTLQFHGTLTSTYIYGGPLTRLLGSIANLECKLDGTTAATCSGYSSFAPGYTSGQYSGPTEVSWTSTLSGTAVEWGTLTLTDMPTETGDRHDMIATLTLPTVASSVLPQSTGTTSAGAGTRPAASLALAVAAAGLLASQLVF